MRFPAQPPAFSCTRHRLPGDLALATLGRQLLSFAIGLPRRVKLTGRCCRSGRRDMVTRRMRRSRRSPEARNSSRPKNSLTTAWSHREFVDAKPDFPSDRVDYGWVFDWKGAMLRHAYDQFQNAGGHLEYEFNTFCGEHASWLDDYALYRSLQASQGQRPWFEWPDDLRARHDDALARGDERSRRQSFARRSSINSSSIASGPR